MHDGTVDPHDTSGRLTDEGACASDNGADEASLLARMCAGESAAYDELVDLYAPQLYATAKRMLGSDADALDAVQEALLGAFRNIRGFDGRSKLSTWLTRIVINRCLMVLRTRRRKPHVSIEDLLPTFQEDGHPTRWTPEWQAVGSLDRRRLIELVREQIDALPERYREVLVLRDVQGLSTEEAAQVLGDTPNAVKVRLHRARQALMTLLSPHLELDAHKGESRE